jgi:16S rRNA (guanine527-N7)-methyltransferase
VAKSLGTDPSATDGGYGPSEFAADLDVSRETLARFKIYADLLTKWQKRINLVGLGSLPDMWRRHMLDSAQVAEHLPHPQSGPIYDVGSGAGFPGMALAILGVPEISLIESDGRKCAFLREVARATETEVRVVQQRLNPGSKSDQFPPAAIVLCRAVAPLPKLLDIVFPVISSSTCCMFLKGAAAGDEVSRARRKWQFQLESIQSRTSPDGVILKLSGIDQNGAAN